MKEGRGQNSFRVTVACGNRSRLSFSSGQTNTTQQLTGVSESGRPSVLVVALPLISRVTSNILFGLSEL